MPRAEGRTSTRRPLLDVSLDGLSAGTTRTNSAANTKSATITNSAQRAIARATAPPSVEYIEERGVSAAFLLHLVATKLGDERLTSDASAAAVAYLRLKIEGVEREIDAAQAWLSDKQREAEQETKALDAGTETHLEPEPSVSGQKFDGRLTHAPSRTLDTSSMKNGTDRRRAVAEQAERKLRGLQRSLRQHKTDLERRRNKPYLTSRDVHKLLVVPETKERMDRYVELDGVRDGVDPETGFWFVGKARYFFSYSWDSPWEDVVSALVAHSKRIVATGKPPPYYWIDIFAVNQHVSLPPWKCTSGLGDKCPGCAAVSADMHDWSQSSSQPTKGFERVIESTRHTLVLNEPWDDPRPPTRVWCLFEGYTTLAKQGELEVVLGPQQQLDLQLSLGDKFGELEARVSNIDARLANATVEADRKQIFRAIEQLQGGFEGLNDEMQGAQRRWLGASADGVLFRTNPSREPLGETELVLEVADIGEGKCYSQACCCPRRCPRCCCCPVPSDAKRTRCLESWPRLPAVLRLISEMVMTLLVCAVVGFGIDDILSDGLHGLDDLFWELDELSLLLIGVLVPTLVLFDLGRTLQQHQADRQLRQPPLLGAWATRHRQAVVGTMSVLLFYLWASPVGVAIATMLTGGTSTVVWFTLHRAANAATTRAELAVKVGWLRLKQGDVQIAEKIFHAAHQQVQRMVGDNDPWRSYIAAPGLAHCLCVLGKATEAAELVDNVKVAEQHAKNRCTQHVAISDIVGARAYWWTQHGPLLRARMAAAVRLPDATVLEMLTQTRTKSREFCCVDERYPELAAFLARMAPGGEGSAEDRAVWDFLPPLVRSGGDDVLSPWVKYTHTEGRSYYKRDDPHEVTTLVAPSGVRQKVEIGMPGAPIAEEWESNYFFLGGQGCCTPDQNVAYKRKVKAYKCKVKARKSSKWLLSGGLCIALFCTLDFAFVDCGPHGQQSFLKCLCDGNFAGVRCEDNCEEYCGDHGNQTRIGLPYCAAGTCDCVGSFVGSRCGSECHCAGTDTNNTKAAGSCGGVSCGTCSNGFVGEFCQLARVYNISGATNNKYDGRYERLAAQCNSKPVYQMVGGDGWVLFQPTGPLSRARIPPYWMVSSKVHCMDSGDGGDIRSNGNTDPIGSYGGSCPESPDGGGCVARWQERDGSDWHDVVSLTVTAGE